MSRRNSFIAQNVSSANTVQTPVTNPPLAESHVWEAVEGDVFPEEQEYNCPDLQAHNNAMNDLIEAERCNSTPTTAEQLVSSVCELLLESDPAHKWDGLQDEWHPIDDGIVPIRQIMALNRREEANTLAQVLEWRPFRSKEDTPTK
ncbi:hypothetical protein PCANC_00518 [Puccinia coronata f. sp. avenae]|uniref:Uncharacterized protein n=1 Tax=Puccinia coronata f. sp. avenae TaxID=200324 RepID=A0A2N5W7Z6_9BASI|nr:hypothetical protein PCANC_00518 [Puccinia coronata f. sp. avenae]